jgi:hypothetical protein
VLTWCLGRGVSHAALCPKKDLCCRKSLPFPVPCLKATALVLPPLTYCCSLAAEKLRISSSLVALVPVRILVARPNRPPHHSPNTESYALTNLPPRPVVPAQHVMDVTGVVITIPAK